MRDLSIVPSPATDDALVALADWAEICALNAADGNISREDLVRGLRRSYSTPEMTARALAGDVFKELADRTLSCTTQARTSIAAYPFTLKSDVLSVKTDYHRRPDYGRVYVFLLAMTLADMSSGARVIAGIDPTKVFEHLCADVLAGFWGGSSSYSGALVFGTARKKRAHNHRFQSNIDHLCSQIGEGLGWKEDATPPGAGDGKLDIVAWRRFPDRRQGGLIGFAQCKTGIHWNKHLTQLQPDVFSRRFMKKQIVLSPVRIYMVPARIEPSQWETYTGEGGILFDRCRIVHYAVDLSSKVRRDSQRWLDAALARQSARRFTA